MQNGLIEHRHEMRRARPVQDLLPPQPHRHLLIGMIVIRARGIGLGSAVRYNIRIADDDRWYLEKFCNKLIASGGACVVLRNDRG